jgi:anti-anti-sigma factor
MSEYEIKQRKMRDDIFLISPSGTLDNNNAHQMIEVITEAQAKGYKNLIIDMSELEFLSSAGVGSILGTVEISREMDGDIIICNVSPNVMRVFEVLDLMDYLTIKPALRDAAQLCGMEI